MPWWYSAVVVLCYGATAVGLPCRGATLLWGYLAVVVLCDVGTLVLACSTPLGASALCAIEWAGDGSHYLCSCGAVTAIVACNGLPQRNPYQPF
eukprot:6189301-Pleurochrysis_carterae.AAC.1